MAYAIPGTNAYPIVCMFLARYWEASNGSLSAIEQNPDMKFVYGNKMFSVTTNYLGFENGQLWTAVTTSIPTDQAYGFGFASTSSFTAFEPSTAVFNSTIEFETEFMGVL